MKQRFKIMTVLGTRPEIIRLSSLIKKLDSMTDQFEHLLVHTGQNYDYELNEIFFKDLALRKPNIFMNAAGQTAMETIGNILVKTEKLLLEHRPDAFLVLGDTNSALAAIVAKRKHIPVFHMEAGNRSFDDLVPEELNRRIVDHTADYNLPYSVNSAQYLINEGIHQDRIFKTGSPMREVLHDQRARIQASQIIQQLGLKPNHYFVVSAHREENVDIPKRFDNLLTTLNRLAETYRYPIIFSTHPRTRKQIEVRNIVLNPLIQTLKPLGFSDYIALQQQAALVLSDSGTINEECDILNLKALNIRYSHERPEAQAMNITLLTGLEPDVVLPNVKKVLSGQHHKLGPVPDYLIDDFSKRVISVLIEKLTPHT
jgi:UDP-N-acetylglucosamine 2-epimerase (non-hydrolysing)